MDPAKCLVHGHHKGVHVKHYEQRDEWRRNSKTKFPHETLTLLYLFLLMFRSFIPKSIKDFLTESC